MSVQRLKMQREGDDVSGIYDAIVVGAGIIGSCTAYELAKAGKSVLLLEQFNFLHQKGSSHGESRTIRLGYAEEYYTEMMLATYDLWAESQDDAGYSVYTKTGQLDFGPRENNKSLAAVVSSVKKFNIDHEVLTSEEVSKRFPMKLDDDWYALYTPDGGILNASKSVAMFQSLAAKHGATLRDRVKVVKITSKPSIPSTEDAPDEESRNRVSKSSKVPEESITELSNSLIPDDELFSEISNLSTLPSQEISDFLPDPLEQDNTVTVLTSRGTSTCRKLILAAGAWTGKLVNAITGIDLPITTLHTNLAYWSVDSSQTGHFSIEAGFPSFNCYSDPYIYGTPANEFPGMIKAGHHSGTPCDPETRSVAPDMATLHRLVAPWLGRVFAGKVIYDAPAIAVGCLYSMTPDEDFILDFLPENPSILVAAGFSGHGFKLAPLVGRIMAKLACNDASEYESWLPHFRFRRFEENPGGNRKDFDVVVVSQSPPKTE